MAAGCSYLLDCQGPWLNIGIAGHPTLELGEPFMPKSLQYHSKSLYPSPLFKTSIKKVDLISVDKPSEDWFDAGYDMESFSFFSVASKAAPIKFIHILKIVSDNKKSSFKKLTEVLVYELIKKNIGVIDKLVTKLEKLFLTPKESS